MDAKDLRTEAALADRSNDGSTKYIQGGSSLPCQRSKTYQDITSNSLSKVDTPLARPCAVIGPDRVVPPVPPAPSAHTDVYYKKAPPEPWLTLENTYHRPPDYPHKLLDYQHPSRNISPRQTFQENMQRIMVAPSYNAGKLKEDHNYPGESNIAQMRNKLTVPLDSNSKYCDVPYTGNPVTNDHKNVRNSNISASQTNTVLSRSMPHGWPPASANIQPPKPLPQDLCQYPEYQNCPAPRSVVMARPHRSVHEEPGPVYPEGFYHNGNIRFKPYPPVKERYPQTRYEYIGNYANPFHPPPPFPTHKYDLQKSIPPHPYPSYQQVPLKYLDNRMTDPIINGYQRSLNQQAVYSNMPYRNQMIHPTYGPVPGSCLPSNKFYPYPTDAAKSLPSNKLPFDNNNKLYNDYEQSNRNKIFPATDTFYFNEIARPHPTKGPVLPPNYPSNIHGMPAHSYYRKEPLKGYEYGPHFRNMDHMLGINGNLMPRFTSQFSSSAIAISPADSNTSNETNLTHAVTQEDCGYVSQSSTASARSMDSAINKVLPDMYKRYEQSYGHIMKGSAPFVKIDQSVNVNLHSKDKKDIDVRQFLQMWNEGEEEGSEGNNKDVNNKHSPNNVNNSANAASSGATNQEQLYVLGLVNVPSEELSKYQHIQKVSKLPENIKGYNSIELLHQFEEVIESSNLNHYNDKPSAIKSFQNTFKSTLPMHGLGIPSRPLSPLDVEAKISQSVIHKEVGCNFEIKPCSPKMLNVEVATPVQTVIGERMIEKVSNPLITQSQVMQNSNESRDDCEVVKSQDRLSVHDNLKIASCKMVSKLFGNKDLVDPAKTNYSIQDLESNSGVCLASLPRLDNDIELNFPEVNQQFINANKVDSVITTVPIKDLPPLDTDQMDPVNKKQEIDVFNSHIKRNSEKDFSRLSKYRKMKRRNSVTSTPEANVQALRTDSVIIKNPENCKHENSDSAVSPENVSQEAQNDPINLSVSNEHCVNSTTSRFSLNKSVDSKPNELAIDFSINANDSSNFTNDIVIPATSPTVKQNLNRGSMVREDHYKTNLSPTDTVLQTLAYQGGNILNENDSENPSESEECHINEPASTKKPPSSNKTTYDLVYYSETHLKEKCNSIKELTLQDTNSEHLQKHIVTDKEILNKKLSSYNLLSPQEKEDTLNEKMRELFGEEFSTVETEPDFEEVHDTQAILDDNATQQKDCVFSDESSQQEKVVGIKCNSSNNCEKTERNYLSEDVSLHDSTDSIKVNKYLPRENSPSKENTTENQVFEHSKSTVIVKSDIDDCITDQCRIKKELLSPWIQKLILHNEGMYGITDVIETRNYNANELNSDFYVEHFETSNEDEHSGTTVNFEITAVVKSNEYSSTGNTIVLDMISDRCETVKLKNDEIDLDTKGFQNAIDEKRDILVSNTVKHLEAANHEIDKNFLRDLETSEPMPEHSGRIDNNTFIKVSDQSGYNTDEDVLNSDKIETHFYTNDTSNISCEILTTVSTKTLEIATENKTDDTLKSCDKIENDNNVIELIHNSENIQNISSDTTNVFTANDEEIEKSVNNFDEPDLESYVQDLIVSNNTIGSEKLKKKFAEISDSTDLKTDENLKSVIEVLKEKDLKMASDHETDKDVGNSTLQNCSHSEISESAIVQETEECIQESSSCGNVLDITVYKQTKLKRDTSRVLKPTNIEDSKENLKNNGLESNISGNYESFQEPGTETNTILEIDNEERIDNICINCDVPKSEICCNDAETVSIKSNKNVSTLKGIEDDCIINDHKVYSEFFKSGLESVNEDKSIYMPEIGNSDQNNELNFKTHKELVISDIQFVENGQSKCSPAVNKISESMLSSKSLESSVNLLNATIGKYQESNITNTSVSCVSKNSISVDSSDRDKNLITVEKIDDNSVINLYKVENETNNADLKSKNENEINDTDSSSNLVPLSHSEDSRDYSLMNKEEPIHTMLDKTTKDFSKVSEAFVNSDKEYSKSKLTSKQQSISVDNNITSFKDIVSMSALTNIKTKSSPGDLTSCTSCSDVSDETSSSDDEDTSDSADLNDFMVNEETDKTCIYNNENKSQFSAEIEHNSTYSEKSDGLSLIKLNDEVKSEKEIKANNKPVSNKSQDNCTTVRNDENAAKEREHYVEEASCEGYAIDSLNEPNFNDLNIASESEMEKNAAALAISDYSEIVRTIDFSVDENDIGDSGFILETSQADTKVENACNDVPSYNNYKNGRYLTSKRRKSLKRCLSDSALDEIRDNSTEDSVLWPNKRKKDLEINNFNTSQLIAQNICHVLQSNRRNSISAIHNEGNVSFCIVIDNNCILSEECDEPEKSCYSEVPEDCVTCIQAESVNHDSIEEISSLEQNVNCVFSTPIQTNEENNILEEHWVEDVACVETVISDDIAENIVISASTSPRDKECYDEETEICNINKHTEKLKIIYGDKMHSDDADFVDTLYRTPQMNVNKTLSNRESQITLDDSRYYDKESLERVLSESNGQDKNIDLIEFQITTPLRSPVISELSPNYSENVRPENHNMCTAEEPVLDSKENYIYQTFPNANHDKEYPNIDTKGNLNSCESIEDVCNYKKAEKTYKCNISSSPEVSSTTSEEKNAGILLKITSYGGSRVSQINNINPIQSISCKYTEEKEYLSSNGTLPTRTLITKGAQKYIPPIKESIRDLKVKLPLPHQSLMKLRQLKMTKEALKLNLDRSCNTFTKNVPKKSKPKFEDVLMSIDELQYQKHRERSRKGRKSIPKVVIKKTVLGSHYASSSSKHQFNPDLTGRKWQPWVFLERDRFIDKMALRNKTRAIFSHRKKTYVLAEKFQRYKSVCNPKFIISQPKQKNSTPGQLKYTIKLKHNY